jgi:hypothetical protein
VYDRVQALRRFALELVEPRRQPRCRRLLNFFKRRAISQRAGGIISMPRRVELLGKLTGGLAIPLAGRRLLPQVIDKCTLRVERVRRARRAVSWNRCLDVPGCQIFNTGAQLLGLASRSPGLFPIATRSIGAMASESVAKRECRQSEEIRV